MTTATGNITDKTAVLTSRNDKNQYDHYKAKTRQNPNNETLKFDRASKNPIHHENDKENAMENGSNGRSWKPDNHHHGTNHNHPMGAEIHHNGVMADVYPNKTDCKISQQQDRTSSAPIPASLIHNTFRLTTVDYERIAQEKIAQLQRTKIDPTADSTDRFKKQNVIHDRERCDIADAIREIQSVRPDFNVDGFYSYTTSGNGSGAWMDRKKAFEALARTFSSPNDEDLGPTATSTVTAPSSSTIPQKKQKIMEPSYFCATCRLLQSGISDKTPTVVTTSLVAFREIIMAVDTAHRTALSHTEQSDFQKLHGWEMKNSLCRIVPLLMNCLSTNSDHMQREAQICFLTFCKTRSFANGRFIIESFLMADSVTLYDRLLAAKLVLLSENASADTNDGHDLISNEGCNNSSGRVNNSVLISLAADALSESDTKVRTLAIQFLVEWYKIYGRDSTMKHLKHIKPTMIQVLEDQIENIGEDNEASSLMSSIRSNSKTHGIPSRLINNSTEQKNISRITDGSSPPGPSSTSLTEKRQNSPFRANDTFNSYKLKRGPGTEPDRMLDSETNLEESREVMQQKLMEHFLNAKDGDYGVGGNSYFYKEAKK